MIVTPTNILHIISCHFNFSETEKILNNDVVSIVAYHNMVDVNLNLKSFGYEIYRYQNYVLNVDIMKILEILQVKISVN